MQNTIIVVDEEPYCVWEVDMKERNEEFLNSIDVDYFDYVLQQHIKSDDKKRASVALQLSYHHAMETFFSYIGAYVQAPDCSYAWIDKCKNVQLRSLVRKISKHDLDIFTKLNVKSVSWRNISELVFQYYNPGTEKQKETIELYSKLWTRLADEFLDDHHITEYNNMKHGFRVRSGGFGLRVGLEHEYGVAPPEEEMKTIGHSEYGVSFFKLEKIGGDVGNRSLRSRRYSINWKVEKTVMLLQLITNSINNVVGALRIANGAKVDTVKFKRPTESDFFEKAWKFTPGLNTFTLDFIIDESQTVPVTKSELLKKLSEYKHEGRDKEGRC